MPRASLGPRLWFDPGRENWVIRDGRRFIRTGAAGWKAAQERFQQYLETNPQRQPQPAPAAGYIYFISADFPEFPVKIGFTQARNAITTKSLQRSKSLQTGCPYRLTVLGTFRGFYADERRLQRQFAAQRLEGEWFARTPELMQTIKDVAQ